MVTNRRGTSKLGCLVSLLLLVTVIYFGVNIGEVFLRYYRFRDEMAQEARFGAKADDDDIKRRLASFADSLGLPEEATRLTIRRQRGGISISSQWTETVELPLFVRQFHFAPTVEQEQ